MTVGQAIHHAFTERGIRSLTDQAAILDEDPSHWSTRYSKGVRSPKASKVADWITHAAGRGWLIVVRCDHVDGWTATAKTAKVART